MDYGFSVQLHSLISGFACDGTSLLCRLRLIFPGRGSARAIGAHRRSPSRTGSGPVGVSARLRARWLDFRTTDTPADALRMMWILGRVAGMRLSAANGVTCVPNECAANNLRSGLPLVRAFDNAPHNKVSILRKFRAAVSLDARTRWLMLVSAILWVASRRHSALGCLAKLSGMFAPGPPGRRTASGLPTLASLSGRATGAGGCPATRVSEADAWRAPLLCGEIPLRFG